ncbi:MULTISPECIES: LysR family transcriptional regulator [Marinobacter]|jgi:DNA-binding transcriptional LysR family regulator|uniref:LysR family transcriptional regulator n=2 Tax=Marinobacter TaxID=2742 RepID=A0A368XCR8_MARNT|nr:MULTISPECIES: LysR family transcriptional regulator [Marinobacter]MEC8899234.1 LysR family transcriptional regulator [Pseudomonadota bacterium]KAE8546054.1 LysR family transcriptional regulator [Marinobacter nauticus]MBN8237865.1 LysR family transcriptional regulator [Marinobacter nauticus]MBW3196718.1 LysR family transcriptional regulator [Marinobacter nauticus]MBY6102606.1 LysR family transcriptional regulator [Marinobacter nauticus]|tara:strand:+ start:1042 stop:1947 length:906 start_codon:yes stop_codon:yes gene_type:complete
MKYSFRQLEVFLAAAHFQNITRAAESLAMSQSAASSALKELESQFDIQLFDRVGKRLQLNELGRLYRPKAESLLAQATELEQAFSKHSEVGALKVGATLTIGNYLAVGVMAKYMNTPTRPKVSLEVANTSSIARRVRDFELDIGLIEGELQSPELEVIPWREDELTVFCSPSHPLARKQALTDEDLRQAVWIMREPGSGTRQSFERGMHGLLPDLNILLELEHTEAIKRAVEADLGIGCLSKVVLADAFKRGSLVPLSVPDYRKFDRQFYFILHKQKYRSAGIARWMSLCQELQPARTGPL